MRDREGKAPLRAFTVTTVKKPLKSGLAVYDEIVCPGRNTISDCCLMVESTRSVVSVNEPCVHTIDNKKSILYGNFRFLTTSILSNTNMLRLVWLFSGMAEISLVIHVD